MSIFIQLSWYRLQKFALVCLFFTLLVGNVNKVFGEALSFNAGDFASYTISQRVNYLHDDTPSLSEGEISFDIKILSMNSETGGHPIDVEITLKKLSFTKFSKMVGKTYKMSKPTARKEIITYDADILSRLRDDSVEKQAFQLLINQPMTFRINGEFNVEETTGILKQFETALDLDSSHGNGVFGTTLWTYRLILTQMFHLAGSDITFFQDYSSSHSLPAHFPVSCYQLLNWEDDSLNENEIAVGQSSFYAIDKIDTIDLNLWRAAWNGTAQVKGTEANADYQGNILVSGQVIWQPDQPLSQDRKFKATIKETYGNGLFGSIEATLWQRWTSSIPQAQEL